MSVCISLPEAWTSPVDLFVLMLGPDGRVAGDDDFIFLQQPDRCRRRRWALRGGNLDGATIDLSLLPEYCERLVQVASGADSTDIVARTALLILDPAAETSGLTFRPLDTTVMPALVCAEIYRVKAPGGYEQSVRDWATASPDSPATTTST